MHKLEDWCLKNYISINPVKSQFIVFHSPHKLMTSDLHIRISNVEIKQISSAKFLGVIVDSNLKFDTHVDSVVKKMASA